MDSNSSDEEEDSDVFYSCDSESLVSNSPIKASIIISEPDDGMCSLLLKLIIINYAIIQTPHA